MSKAELDRFRLAAKQFNEAHAEPKMALQTLREEGLLNSKNRLAAPYREPRPNTKKK